MKLKLTGSAILVVGLLALGIFLFLRYQKEVKDLFTKSLNPASQDNVINKNLNKALFPENDASIGTKIYDIVDTIRDWLPFVESEKEKQKRIADEFLKKREASKNSTQEETINPLPEDIKLRLPLLGERDFN